jgi:hypothetical protein
MSTTQDMLYHLGGVPVGTSNRDISGSTFFVDGNSGLDGNSGKSWTEAYKTLAVAIAASHADIARGADRWARRNTIYIAGDAFEEDLVALPQKTDIIGVGSYNGNAMPCILGNHAPVNAGVGCRIFNVQFEPVTADPILTLTNACWGLELHGNSFRASGTLVAATAIDMTAAMHVKIIGNEFLGAFTGSVIDIGAGDLDGLVIEGNRILGGAAGGIIVTGATTINASRMGIIARNDIYVAGITINDGADSTLVVVGNNCVSATTYGSGSHVITVAFAANNYVTANGASYLIPAQT